MHAYQVKVLPIPLLECNWKAYSSLLLILPFPHTHTLTAGAVAYFAMYTAYMAHMAWNVTLDPHSPKWSMLLKQVCAVVIVLVLTAFMVLGIQQLLRLNELIGSSNDYSV